MPKLGNETLKAELGRAAWKVLHTTMSRYPDKPNEDERTALFSYIHLFARLYPWYRLFLLNWKGSSTDFGGKKLVVNVLATSDKYYKNILLR